MLTSKINVAIPNLIANMIKSGAIITQTASVDTSILVAMMKSNRDREVWVELAKQHDLSVSEVKELRAVVKDLRFNPVLAPLWEQLSK